MFDNIALAQSEYPEQITSATVEITTGRLVIIGPTTRENGLPDEVCELSDTAAVWIGWVPMDQIAKTRAKLQRGNPEKLAIYAMANATLGEVSELKRIVGRNGHKRRGNWFTMWSPLAYLIQELRGNID